MPEAAPTGGAAQRRPSFGPVVAVLIISVTVFSVAATQALDGIPNTENGLFLAMGRVMGLPVAGMTVASPVWLLVARVAGLVMLASLVGVGVVRKRFGQGSHSA